MTADCYNTLVTLLLVVFLHKHGYHFIRFYCNERLIKQQNITKAKSEKKSTKEYLK